MIPLLVITASEKNEQDFMRSLALKEGIFIHNVCRIMPEKESIGIDDIRAISPLILTHAPTRRLIAVHKFGTATTEAQNAFLKILEEKNTDNLFVLFAQSSEHIIPTVLSRVRLTVLDKKSDRLDPKRFEELDAYFRQVRETGYAFLFSPAPVQTREDALLILDDFVRYFETKLVTPEGEAACSIIKKAFQTKNQIMALNCNPQLSLDNLLIFIHKTATMKLGNEKK